MADQISIYSTRTMMAALVKMKPSPMFLRDIAFRGVEVFDEEKVDVDIYKGKRKLAPYISRVEYKGKVKKRLGQETRTIVPPYSKQLMPVQKSDGRIRLAGEQLYSTLSVEDRLQALVGRNLAEMNNDLDRLEEWQCAQVLFTGKIVELDGREIDYLFPTDHKVTLTSTDLWSDAASDPYAHFEAWREKILEKCGAAPTDVVLGSLAWAALRNNTKFQKQLDIRLLEVAQINPQVAPAGYNWPGVSLLGRISALNLNLWAYSNWYADDSDVTQSMVPAKKISMFIRDGRGTMLYGGIEHLESRVPTKRFPNSWTENDGSKRWMSLEAAPLANPVDVESILFAQVLA